MIVSVVPENHQVRSGTTVEIELTTSVDECTVLVDSDDVRVECPDVVAVSSHTATFNVTVGILDVGEQFKVKVRYKDQIVTLTFTTISTTIATIAMDDLILVGAGDTTTLTVTLTSAAPTTGVLVYLKQKLNGARGFEELPNLMYIASGNTTGTMNLTSQAVTRPLYIEVGAYLSDEATVPSATAIALVEPGP